MICVGEELNWGFGVCGVDGVIVEYLFGGFDVICCVL